MKAFHVEGVGDFSICMKCGQRWQVEDADDWGYSGPPQAVNSCHGCRPIRRAKSQAHSDRMKDVAHCRADDGEATARPPSKVERLKDGFRMLDGMEPRS